MAVDTTLTCAESNGTYLIVFELYISKGDTDMLALNSTTTGACLATHEDYKLSFRPCPPHSENAGHQYE
jgi:hypothetical protein